MAVKMTTRRRAQYNALVAEMKMKKESFYFLLAVLILKPKLQQTGWDEEVPAEEERTATDGQEEEPDEGQDFSRQR